MGTYLYCIHADAVSVPPALAGIDGAPVRALDVSSLEAWVSDVREVPVTVSVERIRAHDAVCAAALESDDTPLPIRFGQTFATDADVTAAIDARASELSSRLRRVAGCVELRVVLRSGAHDGTASTGANVATDEDALVQGPGTAFLKRLAREGRADLVREVACEDARRALRAAAKGLIVDQQPCEIARGVSYFALLIKRADVEAVRDLAARVLSSMALKPVVMGPFAPYSFAGDA